MRSETRAADDDTIIGIESGHYELGGGDRLRREALDRGGGREAILPSCVGLDDAGAVIVGRPGPATKPRPPPSGRCSRSSA